MSTLDAALAWLARGVAVVPLQPNSKRLVAGYGFYLERVTTEERARFWFGARPCNLAVVCDGLTVLDFDQVDDYERACERWPVLRSHYTERTRRGFHVFGIGESGSGVASGGWEVLGRGKVCASAPSVVGGLLYAPLDNTAAISRLPAALVSLSEKRQSTHTRKEQASGADTIARIKAAWSVVDVARDLTKLRQTQSGAFVGLCPFHEERAASFWCSEKSGLWGCHSCGAHGDVINLYARARGLSVAAAVGAMAGVL